jgi:hypothetical protein
MQNHGGKEILKRWISILIVFPALTVFGVYAFAQNTGQKQTNHLTQTAPGFALVELFTSEGCSSCPPAEQFLNDIIREAKTQQRPVYALAFHVDYWNYIGWTDEYSRSEYTQRQYDYAGAFKEGRVYTPQMIVNGTDFFVGSDRSKGANAINTALSTAPEILLNIDAATKGRDLEVSYILDKSRPGLQLNIAVVQSGLKSKVTRGENSGRTLAHDNVVRVFKTIDISGRTQGKAKIKFPDTTSGDHELIGYIQKKNTMRIIGAVQVKLNNP